MIKIANLQLNRSIKTKHYVFLCIRGYGKRNKSWTKRNRTFKEESIVLASAKTITENPEASIVYPKQEKIQDYCFLLSLAQNRNIFPVIKIENGKPIKDYFYRMGKSYDWPILDTNETEQFLNAATDSIDNLDEKRQVVVFETLLWLFEADFFTKYRDLKDVWYLLSFEHFCRSIYSLDKNQNPESLKRTELKDMFMYVNNDKFQLSGELKSIKGNKNINSFLQDVATVRNWVMHGKVWDKSDVVNKYGSNGFTFYYRLSSLLKIYLFYFLDFKNFTNKDSMLQGIAYGNAVCPSWDLEKGII